MPYATLMVHVDVDAELGCRVGIAAGLAERFRAHLIGVADGRPCRYSLPKTLAMTGRRQIFAFTT